MPREKAVESVKQSQRGYIAHCLAIGAQIVRSETMHSMEIEQLGRSREFAAAGLCTPDTTCKSPLDLVRAGRSCELIDKIRRKTHGD